MSDLPVVKVSDLNNYMARLIAAQSVLAKMRVEGELANVRHRSGHWYFSCRMRTQLVVSSFKGQASSLSLNPRTAKVVVLCRAGFRQTENFSSMFRVCREAGLGDLYEA